MNICKPASGVMRVYPLTIVLVVVEIQIKPGIIREIYHDEIDRMHGQLSKVDGAIL